jgi:hypothetical protein
MSHPDDTPVTNELGLNSRRQFTQDSSRNQKHLISQAQSEIVRNQYFTTEPSDSSKAIVQSLLSKNENVNSQLSRLFGHRVKSKNSSIHSDFNTGDESHLYATTSAATLPITRQDAHQRSPLNAYPTRQKQLSPNHRPSANPQNNLH